MSLSRGSRLPGRHPGLLRRLLPGVLLTLVLAPLFPPRGGAGVSAQPAPQGAGQGALPAPVGYVNDFANVLPADARARVEALALQVRAATRGDMVVVTLPSLQGRPVEEVALRLGREWKVGATAAIGDEARNAGVIILVVPKETSDDGRGYCRIEVGQGAEGFITDATAGALCREQVPRFRQRESGGAVVGLAQGVAGLYAQAFGVSLEGAQAPRTPRRRERDSGFPVVLVIILVLFLLSALGGRRRRSGCVGCLPIPIPGPPVMHHGWHRGGWGGGGFGGGGGGGFGGFGGGGGFSGGGGGSNW